MKTAISLPDELFRRTDDLAAHLGKSRSEVVADALREHVRRHGDAAVTDRLNAVYGELSADAMEDEFREAAARDVAEHNPW